MKEDVQLRVASVLAVALMTFHLTDDALHTREGVSYPVSVAVLALWLCGGVLLAGQRSGYVITLLGAIFGTGVPLVHFQAAGGVIGGASIPFPGTYHFVWNLLALGTISVYSGVLSLLGLWRVLRGSMCVFSGRRSGT